MQVRLLTCWVKPTGFPFLPISALDFQRRFPDSDACLQYLFELRFYNAVCPKCGRTNSFYRQRGKRSFMCSCGRHQIYPMMGTVFENSSLPLLDWFRIIRRLYQQDSLSATAIERQLKVTYATAWRMRKKLLAVLNAFRARTPDSDFESFLRVCCAERS